MPDAPLVWERAEVRPVYATEGWCFAGRWGWGRCWTSWEFCKPTPWHHRLQTPSTPHHILSTCNLWPCLLLIVEWGSAHKNNRLLLSPGLVVSEAGLGFFISAPVRTQETLLPQSWNICLRKEGISSFQSLCFACAPVIACFVNARQSKPIQTFLGNGTFKR